MERDEEGSLKPVRYEYKADIREPYMGNTVPIEIVVDFDRFGDMTVTVKNEEGTSQGARLKRLTRGKDVQPLNT